MADKWSQFLIDLGMPPRPHVRSFYSYKLFLDIHGFVTRFTSTVDSRLASLSDISYYHYGANLSIYGEY